VTATKWRTAALLAVMLVTACSSDDEGTLVVTGSSTVAPPISDIATDFEQANPGLRVDVQTGGSSRGIADVRRGTAAVGMVSRALTENESDLTAHVIARDGLTLLVHADNPLNSLDDDAVRRIFRGEIDNWSELTDFDQTVTVIHKGAGRATRTVFLAHFTLDNRDVEADMVVGENQQSIRSVTGNRGAIAYVSMGSAQHEVEQGVPVRPIALSGASPTVTAIAENDYPLSRNLKLVTRGEPEGLAAEFIRFVRGEEGRQRLREHFFVPVDG